jgi:hypothetical protein
MAIWQYDVRVIPRGALAGWLRQPSGLMPSVIDEESMEAIRWWKGADPGTLEQIFALLLPRRDSWHPGIPSWGIEDGHRIDLVMTGDDVEEVFVRVDVRQLSDGFLSSLLVILTEHDWLLVTPRMRIIEPWPEEFWRELRDSPVCQFVDDTEGFFRDCHGRVLGVKRDAPTDES